MIIPGILASSKTGHLWTPSQDYVSISTATVTSGGTASITFSFIPSTYTHLQIRGILQTTATSGSTYMTFNSDSASNYRLHLLYGTGSAVSAYASGAAGTYIAINDIPGTSYSSSIFGAFILDVLDYTSTNKNKTTRSLYGFDVNGSGGEVALGSGVWFGTPAAVNTITLTPSSGNFALYSQVSLYGVK